MKNTLLYLAAAAFAAHFSSAALAENYGKAYEGMKHDEIPMKSSMMGKHDMTGTVETIDYKTGMMKVKTGVGPMDIHFPPPTIKDLKVGDSITLHLGYTKDGGMMK